MRKIILLFFCFSGSTDFSNVQEKYAPHDIDVTGYDEDEFDKDSATSFFDQFSSAHELFLLTQSVQKEHDSSGLFIRVDFSEESETIKKKIEALVNFIHERITNLNDDELVST